jgi:phosphoglycolate phosphatase
VTPSSSPELSGVRGVIFDLDGTLVDGYQGITSAVNAARERFGLDPLEVDDVKRRVGSGLEHLMADVVGPDRSVEGAAIFRRVYDAVCVEQTRAVPGLAATLDALADRGFRMSVASNKPVGYSVRILERLGVLPRFDSVEGPESVGALKPDPAMVRACLAAMSVAADRAVYVGDMTLDAETGRRANVRVVLVAGGSCSIEDLRGTGAPVIENLGDLEAILPSRAAPELPPR